MPEKDINIHVRTPGAPEARQELGQTKNSVEELGGVVKNTNKDASQSSEQVDFSVQKQARGWNLLGAVINRLRREVVGLITGWLGISAILHLLDLWIAKQQKIVDLMKEMHQKSLELGEVGQAIEFETGTVGKQKEWTQAALTLKQAGGLKDAATAQAMMISANRAFVEQGGIQNPQIMQMLKQVSPFFGMSGMSAADTQKIFDYARQKQIAPAPGAMWHFLGRLSPAMRQTGSVEKAIELIEKSGAVLPPEVAAQETRLAWMQSQEFLKTGTTQSKQIATKGEKIAAGYAGSGMEKFLLRMQDIQNRFTDLQLKGQDRWILDKHEPTVMAIEEMIKELQSLGTAVIPPDDPRRDLAVRMDLLRSQLTFPSDALLTPQASGIKAAEKLEEELFNFEKKPSTPPVINIHHDNSVHYHRALGAAKERTDKDLR